MMKRLVGLASFAILASAIGLAAPAYATEEQSTPPCVSGVESDNLDAIRSTLLLVADDYERKAVSYASQAERYRARASAEDVFAAERSRKHLSAQALESRAAELDHAAAESRELAAKYRQLVYAHARAQGC
jgi:hypothetical protein